MNQHPSGSADGPSPRRLNACYIALLVGAAVLILVVGAILRPKTAELVAVLPGNELATLPERSQRREFRDMANYIGQRVASLAASVVYLPALGASGVVVGRDSVLSAAVPPRAPEVLVVQRVEDDSAKPAPRVAGGDAASHRWALAVARAPDGELLSLAALTGSAVPIRCGDLTLRELAFGGQLPEAFAGGGLFDLDGDLLALAMPCVDHIALVPLRDVVEALERQGALESRLWARLGFRVAPTRDLLIGGLNLFPASFIEVRVRHLFQIQDAGILHHDLLVNFQFGF
jgi:hypothetical protein